MYPSITNYHKNGNKQKKNKKMQLVTLRTDKKSPENKQQAVEIPILGKLGNISQFALDNLISEAVVITIKDMPKPTVPMVHALLSLADAAKWDIIRAIRLNRLHRTPIKFYEKAGVEYTLKELKKWGIVAEAELIEVEVKDESLPPGWTIYDFQRDRLKHFPELEAFLKKKGVIIKFCKNCDCKDWTKLSNAFQYEKTPEKEVFWTKLSSEFYHEQQMKERILEHKRRPYTKDIRHLDGMPFGSKIPVYF
jgi:hypothetical protein